MAKTSDLDQFACHRDPCPDKGKRGKGNLRLHDTYGSGTWRRFKCTTCKGTFSERRGTILFRVHIPEGQFVQILSLVSRGSSMAATAEAVGVDENTVASVLRKAGKHAQELHEHLVTDLCVGQVQADEIFTYVEKRGSSLFHVGSSNSSLPAMR